MAPSPLPFDVALVPGELAPERAEGTAAVVVDVLRFSTALVRAFESGAASARVVAGLEEARALVARGEADLACGERGGVRPEGFELGNSPFDFTPAAVGGRRLAFTTTNGTRAVLACRTARRLLVGCLRNRSAVAATLDRLGLPVLVACAGTEGRFSLEDVLAAGALAEALGERRELALTDGAAASLALWRWRSSDPRAALRDAEHGRTLFSLGFGADVDFAAESSPGAPVPALDSSTGLLVSPAPA